MNILITGGTGFLGKNVLRKILQSENYQKIFLLIRPQARKSSDERLLGMLEEILPPSEVHSASEKCIAVDGDLTVVRFGMDEIEFSNLASKVNQVLHIGASTDFGAPLDISRKFNVCGTEEVLKFCQTAKDNGNFYRLEYISTAFVAGIKKGMVSEKELNRGQKFANNYEQSKCEAEQLVYSFSKNTAATIYRPSIVVGDSRHGYTSHFKVLYWPLRILSKNLLPFIPLNKKAKLDVVPIDYVSNSIAKYMMLTEPPEKVLYITSGVGNEVSIGGLLEDAEARKVISGRPTIPFFFFNLLRLSFLKRFFSDDFWQTCQMASPYYHYLKGTGVSFDARRSHQILSGLGVEVPSWTSYKGRILDYCLESRWGRRKKRPSFEYYT